MRKLAARFSYIFCLPRGPDLTLHLTLRYSCIILSFSTLWCKFFCSVLSLSVQRLVVSCAAFGRLHGATIRCNLERLVVYKFFIYFFLLPYLFFLLPLWLIGLPVLARRHTLPRIFNCSERSERIYPTNCPYVLLTVATSRPKVMGGLHCCYFQT